MRCPKCGKPVQFSEIPYRYLETYNAGGTCVSVSSCCNAAFNIRMVISYKTTLYEGSAKEDDWGHKINKFRK